MINRFRSSAAIIAATVILTGCGSSSSSKKNSTTLPGSTAGFPGGTVEANYLADDGKAFSNSAQDVAIPLQMFWNKSNGHAIGIFLTQPYNSQQNVVITYAAWFDGTSWHAPVEIHGQNEDAASIQVGLPIVLWLNTTGSTDQNTLARNGDAIILYSRADVDPPTASDADTNVRLYGTYFDVSAAGSAASGTIQGGFDTLARVLDHDNVVLASNTLLTGEDSDVTGFAFASDSLAGSHALTGGTSSFVYDPVDSGDLTTFVHLLYRKDPTSGDPLALTDLVGERWWSIPFNLAQVGNSLPVATGASELPITGLDTAATTENVGGTLTVHNGHVFAQVTGVAQAPGGDDTALVAYAFSTALTPTMFEVSSARQTNSADVASLPTPANTYGADHGLASTLFFFEETGFHDTGVTGNRSANRDHMLGELRVAGGVTSIGTGSPMDVDGSQGLIDVTTDGDTDMVFVRVGTAAASPGAVAQGSLQSRINRSGTAIIAIWTQHNDDQTDLDDTTNTIGTHSQNNVPYVTAIQTRLDAADARLLSASIAAVGTARAVKSAAFFSTSNSGAAAGQIQDPAFDLRFQQGLAGGQATSQSSVNGALNAVPCDRGATFQGNHLRMSFTYTQGSDRTPGGDIDNTVLYLNSVTVTLGTAPTAAPTMALTNATVAAAAVDEVDDFYNASLTIGQALAVDAGDATATAGAGRVLVFFPSNENNPLENVAGSFDEQRLFVSEQTAAGTAGPRTLVSSDPATAFLPHAMQQRSLQGLMVVPVNANTVTTPNHVGTRIHLYWVEERDVPGTSGRAARRLATRSYTQASTTATTPVALGNRFVPALPSGPDTGAPSFIDVPSSGDLLDTIISTAALRGGRNGDTVGVFFDEDAHLYYTETATDGASYPTSLGVADPALVDNDSSFAYDILSYDVAFPPVGNNLARCQASFNRFDSASNVSVGIGRLFVRSHN